MHIPKMSHRSIYILLVRSNKRNLQGLEGFIGIDLCGPDKALGNMVFVPSRPPTVLLEWNLLG